MTEIQFVNIHGDPVRPDLMPQAKPAKKQSTKRTFDADAATEHHGWEVVGVPSWRAEEARRAAADKQKPFDLTLWLNAQKSRRALPRVFHIDQAAREAAAILSRDPKWLRVEVLAIMRAPA